MPANEPVSFFLNYGILGAFTVLWITGWIHTRSRTERAEKQADDALANSEKVIDAINKLSAAFEAWRSVERRDGPR